MPKLITIEKLIFGHSLVSNTCPKGIKLEEFNKRDVEVTKQVEKFGLFESATPNFATYYPNVSPEDLAPKDADFVFPVFRALSEVLVRPFAPIDFSLNGVLRDSMSKLVGQTVFPNHEQLIGNELGVVLDVVWQDSYKVGDVKVPAGINSRLKLDGKAHPQIARGVMMEPPSIHSTSVTVEFEWEKSHGNMTDEEFYNKLGQFDDKGNLVKRNVTKVRNFHEISLVPHGADAFAQKVGKDGKIVNPQYAGNVYKFNAEDEPGKGSKLHFFSYKEIESFSTTDSAIPNEPNNKDQNQTDTEMKEKLIAMLLLTGMLKADIENLSEEQLQTKVNEFISGAVKDKGTISSLTDTNTQQKTELDTLKGQITEKDTKLEAFKDVDLTVLKADAEIGKKALAALKAEVTRLYTLSCGDKSADQAMVDMIANSGYDAAKVLLTQYSKLAEDQFQASCKDCGSHNISRMSAGAKDEGAGKGENDDTSTSLNKSNDDVMASFTKGNNSGYLGGKI